MTSTFSPRIRLHMALAALLAPAMGLRGASAQDLDLPPLKDVYADRFLIGAAVSPRLIERDDRAALLVRNFNSITATNAMKANYLTDAQGRYTFGPADQLADFCAAHNIKLRGHTLLWHSYGAAAPWFFEGGNASVIRQRLETYVHDVVSHFRGKVYAWDVVNEVISDGETVYREDSPWYRALGPDYIEWTFRAARDADPDTQLFINDYDTEEPPKNAKLMQVVDDLIAKGVTIHGVGHQLHMKFVQQVDGVRAAFRAAEARNLINHVTELDVSAYNDPGSCFSNQTGCHADYGSDHNIPAEVLDNQTRLYRELFAMFVQHDSLQSVTTWGLTDQDSWLNGFPVRRANAPLLFDREGRAKPALRAITARRPNIG
jgi:endo-1,4-beta-xylanase